MNKFIFKKISLYLLINLLGLSTVFAQATVADFSQYANNNNAAPATVTTVTTNLGAPTPTVTTTTQETTITTKPKIPKHGYLSYRESEQAMLDSAPPIDIPTTDEANIAFNSLMQQNMPLSPIQVVKLHQLIDASQRAAAIPPQIPPKPVSSTIMINLAPGTTPPAIRLAKGYVSSLVFVDSTGAPWPIASFDLGDPRATKIQWDGKSNVLLLQAQSPYSDGNLVVTLVGLMTPVTLEIVSGQRVVDFRADIHVSGLGPNTKELPTGTPLPNPADEMLLSVLDGVAPTGSRLLVVKGGDCQAWLLGETMYLRTRLTLLSPGFIGKMISPDGMIAYQIQRSSSILVSRYGEPIELKIEGL